MRVEIVSDKAADPSSDESAEVGSRQKDREARRDEISADVKRAFELVPEAGVGWRWYDPPCKVLMWLTSSWRRRLFPWRLLIRLNAAINFLLVFNHYDRLKVQRLDDRLHNLIVPPHVDVVQGGIWVVEFFPPSYYNKLYRELDKNGWDRANQFRATDGTNAEQITRARRGLGMSWSRIGAVARPNSRYLTIDAKRENLPDEFDLVDLTAVQMGRSLTAVTAFFRLSENGGSRLNTAWKATHEPTLEWRGLQRPHVEDRHFAALHATQRERQRLHDLARDWLAERCGGFFAETAERHPVLDFSLFHNHDPRSRDEERTMSEPLRALGMDSDHFYQYISPQIAGAVLVPGGDLDRSSHTLRNCWGVVGSYEVVAEQNDRAGYGPKPYRASTLAGMLDDAVRAFLLHIAVKRYTEELQEAASNARDTARTRHSRFRSRQLDGLRRELLTTSLDLPVVAEDSGLLWTERWRAWNGIEVLAEPAPGVPERARETFDVIEEFGKRRTEAFATLLKEDAAYRDVLSTSASLGASASNARLAQSALAVAVASFVVALVTLLATAGDPSLLAQVLSWAERML